MASPPPHTIHPALTPRAADGRTVHSERKPAAAGGHLGAAQGFKHDGAVAWALVPALALAASAGGTVCLWTLTVGAMLSYTLDALRMREACLSAIWGTLLLVDIGLLFSAQVSVPLIPLISIHRR